MSPQEVAQRCRIADRPVYMRELKLSQVYCVLKAYLDESYDNRTMCIGGWLCNEDTWNGIETKWLQRIEYERRISVKRGEDPISRYHATDCANLKREFSTWDIPRQITLTKRLIDILGRVRPKPIGIASGLPLKELRTARPDLDEKLIKQAAYYLCMCDCFRNIGEAMDENFSEERVVVLHDFSKDFNRWALEAYEGMEHSKFPYTSYFKSIAPGHWQDFPALQPADLIAFEGFKLTAQTKREEQDLRKSLQRVMGHGVNVYAGFYNARGLGELSESIFAYRP